MPVISFTSVGLPYGWLGNMAPYPVEYEGRTWRTTEALFQALRFSDENIREEIRAEASPMAAKLVAKRHKKSLCVEPMSDEDVRNMEFCIQLKIAQHPELKERLLRTGTYTIYEDVSKRVNKRSMFWGARKHPDGTWEGQNVLGRIWMKIREELTSK